MNANDLVSEVPKKDAKSSTHSSSINTALDTSLFPCSSGTHELGENVNISTTSTASKIKCPLDSAFEERPKRNGQHLRHNDEEKRVSESRNIAFELAEGSTMNGEALASHKNKIKHDRKDDFPDQSFNTFYNERNSDARNDVTQGIGDNAAATAIIKTPLTKTLLKRSNISYYNANSLHSNGNDKGSDDSNRNGNTKATFCHDEVGAAGVVNDDRISKDCCNDASVSLNDGSGHRGSKSEKHTTPRHHHEVKLNGDEPEASSNDIFTKLPTTSTITTANAIVTNCNKCNNNNNIHYNNYNCYYRKKTRMPICRIMTLSRGPYSELDKMSLFQDLKLKRRKIDSRCSSDGESVADTSTSSPDLLIPMSPKMYDSGGSVGPIPPLPHSGTILSSSYSGSSSTIDTLVYSSHAAALTSSASITTTADTVVAPTIKKEQQSEIQGTSVRIVPPSVMSPPSTAIVTTTSTRSSPVPTDMSITTTEPRKTPTPASTTATVADNSGISSIRDDNRRGTSPKPCEEKSSTPPRSDIEKSDKKGIAANENGKNASGNNNGSESTISGSSVSNLSVIRSVKEERLLSSPSKTIPIEPLPQTKALTQSQQHVTVLVTPSRIKSEPLHQQQQFQKSQVSYTSVTSSGLTSTPALPASTAIATTTTTGGNTSSLRMSSPPAQHHSQTLYHHHNLQPPIVQTHHLHQQLTQPQIRKSTSPAGNSQLSSQHILNQSIHHLAQHQQLQLLQHAAVMSRPTQISPNSRQSLSPQQPPVSSPHHLQHQQQHMRVKKEPCGQGSVTSGSSIQRRASSPHHYQQHQISSQQQQQQQHSQSLSHLPSQTLGNIAQLMSPVSLQSLRHPTRDAAILLRVKNEVQQQVAAAQLLQPGAAVAAAAASQRMVWVSNARINGVKPEVIGGPLGNLRPCGPPQSPSPHNSSSSSSSQLSPQTPSQTPPRGTPTVIMGESCGVRTMVWGYEPTLPPPTSSGPSPTLTSSSPHVSPAMNQHHQHSQQQQPSMTLPTSSSLSQQSHHSSQPSFRSASSPSAGSITPTHTPGPSPQNNEEAAQLLLSLGQTRIQDGTRTRPHQFRAPHALNMERLWAGDYSQLPPGQLHALNLSAQQQWGGSNAAALQRPLDGPHEPTDEDDQPLVCMICEDKATGLHYGIITCEGCKGFFKRTVQNRRVYTCVADGTCEITKAQRNRCQYCRFKKCIEQGMVLQAVREDRMPGGRNSGAVYNLYKVKYKKHKKTAQKQQQQHQQQQQQQQQLHSPHQQHHQTQLSPHHQGHLLTPQQHLQQQQLAAAAAVAAVAQQQQSKLLSSALNQSEMKPMFLGPALKQEHVQQHQQQQSQQIHSPHHTQQLLSPHHSLHGSPHGQLSNVSSNALQSPLSHPSAASASSTGQQQQQHHQQQLHTHPSPLQHHLHSPQQQQHQHQQAQQSQQSHHSQHSMQLQETAIKLPSHLVNGTILKTALTNPSEIVHLRHRLDSAVSSSKDRQISYEHALAMIQTLIDCDAMEDIATLPHFSEFLEDKSEISEKLCNIGDSIVHKLVSWTKKLPFYLEIPVEIHTKLLTDKWHEILILTTAAYQALYGRRCSLQSNTPSGENECHASATSTTAALSPTPARTLSSPNAQSQGSHNNAQSSALPSVSGSSGRNSPPAGNSITSATNTACSSSQPPPKLHPSSEPPTLSRDDPEFVAEVNAHLSTLQTCLTTLMGQPIAMEQLKLDVGHMVDKMTQITIMFRRIKLKMEEYVCLKVYILLNKAEVELESIQERYVQVLRTYLQHSSPQNPQSRLTELLSHIPEIQAAAGLLLESKMFYVPFVLNSASIR